MDKRLDIAIVGSGPAGLSAALNAKIRNKNFIVFGSKNLSDKIERAPKVNNYLGFPEGNGKDLKDAFQKHIDKMGIEIVNERINNIYAMGDYFALMVNQKMYEAKSIILATGIEYTKPLKGEEAFLGKGVGYCATCDAPLYKGKKVIIVSYTEEGVEDANFLSELASDVYFVPMYNGDYDLKDNINIVNKKPVEIVGETKVEKLVFSDGSYLEADGIFLMKSAVSPTQLVPGLETEEGHIKVDRLMQTNIKGCFAAGDCVGKPYQYIKAAGEGNIAALSAVSYLG